MWTIEKTTRALALGLLLSSSACDPVSPADTGASKAEPGKNDADNKPAESGKNVEPEPTPEPSNVAVAEPTGSSGRTAEPTLEDCLFGCENGADMSEDDVATCRVRCKNNAPGGTTSRHPIIGAYLGCFDSCASKSDDDRPTCHKNCAVSVSAGTGDPATSVCPRRCTEAFGKCLTPCDEKSEDNAATCRKQCEVVAEKCVVGCK
jgi:hypothetical protein